MTAIEILAITFFIEGLLNYVHQTKKEAQL
jgi:hypothetical protein